MADETDIDPNNWGENQFRPIDEVIAAFAACQEGLVARWQLRGRADAGKAIAYRLATKRLYEVYRGVYALSPSPLSTPARRMAAVLAGGPGTVASHYMAAAAWHIRRSERLEITTPTQRRRPGITCHHRHLPADETTTLYGLPITGPSRTIFDMAPTLKLAEVKSAIHEAEVQRLRDNLSLTDLLLRYPGARGTATVREAIRARALGGGVSQWELEKQWRVFHEEIRLPPYLANVLIEGFECDCVWPDKRVIVELDGRAAHLTVEAFERDRRRDRALAAKGWTVIRVTPRMLIVERDELAADLFRLLG